MANNDSLHDKRKTRFSNTIESYAIYYQKVLRRPKIETLLERS
jgi:hypothetical protein